jgi:V/A-type H+-transporting ATPase subunit G/H
MNEGTIARILEIEQDAAETREEAYREAEQIAEQARQAVAQLREEASREAQQEAQQIVSAGREAAEAARTRILSKAEVEAERMEQQAATHLDQAVDWVLGEITGQL